MTICAAPMMLIELLAANDVDRYGKESLHMLMHTNLKPVVFDKPCSPNIWQIHRWYWSSLFIILC